MSKDERIENPKVREYIYDFFPKKTNSNPLFVKVFGKSFSRRQIRKELLTLYTDEPMGPECYLGYHTSGDKSITICKSSYQSSKDLLTPKDIETSIHIQETVVHESVHAILERNRRECKQRNIQSGTGILERYDNDSELGRGLNEGFTEWMCGQFGYETKSYKELTNFVRLIEVSIGTERTMELGKGDIERRLPEILGINVDEVRLLLAKSDSLYQANKQLTIYNGLKNYLDRKLHHSANYTQEELDADEKKYGPYIEGCIEFKGYLDYLNKNNLDISQETVYQWLKDSYIPSEETIKAKSIIDFESQILNTYFLKDIERVFETGENLSREDYLRYKKIVSLLATDYKIPDEIKKSKEKYTSLLVKDELKNITEKCLKRFALEDTEKYKNGRLSLSELIESAQELYLNEGDQVKHFKAFFDVVSPENSIKMTELCLYLSQALKRSEEKGKDAKTSLLKEIDGYGESRVYGITDDTRFLSIALIWGKGGICDSQHAIQDSCLESESQEPFFDLTDTGQYPKMLANFDKIKKAAFEKNPNCKIHIVSSEIIIENGDKCSFFHVCPNGDIVPMTVVSHNDLQFSERTKEERSQENQMLAVSEPSVGIFATFTNAIKKGLHRITSGRNGGRPNYIQENGEIPGKIQFSTRPPKSISTIDSYRVEDYDEKLKTSREEDETRAQNGSETKDTTIHENESGRDDN